MARLYDRVMAQGCEPFRLGDVFGRSDEYRELLEVLARKLAKEDGATSEAEIEREVDSLMSNFVDPPSSERLSADRIEGAHVIVADEVARYYSSLRTPIGGIHDLMGVMVPPFACTWVEAQGVPNAVGAQAFGALIEIEDEAPPSLEGSGLHWVIHLTLVVEWRKGHPAGPCFKTFLFLSEDGTWPLEGKWGASAESLGEFPVELPQPLKELAMARLAFGLVPVALLTLSFLHCKNVDVREERPPEKLARKSARKRGRPLTSFHVLDIQPMRRVLDSEGEAQTKGLRHALHICRGHFKTYGPDAPLLGRHVGTYLWPSQVRGSAQEGVVDKDYRIRLNVGLGREYLEANQHSEIAPTAAEHTGIDPDLGGRGLRAHAVTQNLLAAVVEEAGYSPRRPKPDEPQYDLAWEAGDVAWVAEVKSITPQNEERQLRVAVGQVLRYRQLLSEEGRTAEAMIVVEREPSDASWASLCADEGIVLLWPGHPSFASLTA